MYYLCEKYYESIIVQYYIADCVSWVPRLCWPYEQSGLMNRLSEWNLLQSMGPTVVFLPPLFIPSFTLFSVLIHLRSNQ